MTIHEIVEGVVESRNAKNIWVDDQRCTVSQFKPVELPPIGAHVKVGVDSKGFIVSLEVLDGEPHASDLTHLLPDQTSTRLAVLEAAARFAAGRQDIKSADVLRIADSWLEWVER